MLANRQDAYFKVPLLVIAIARVVRSAAGDGQLQCCDPTGMIKCALHSDAFVQHGGRLVQGAVLTIRDGMYF